MGNSWASKVANAQAHGAGNYIDKHGNYLFVITEVIGKVGTDAGFKGESVIFRLKVVESSKKSPTDADEPHGVGDTRTVVFNFAKDEMAAGKMKAMLLAVVGKKEKEVDPAMLEKLGDSIIQPNQPIMGKLIKGETYQFTAKKTGKPGVGVTWAYVPQTAEQLAAERAKLMGGGSATPAAPASEAAPAA